MAYVALIQLSIMAYIFIDDMNFDCAEIYQYINKYEY